MALGYTLQLPEEDRFLVSKQELSDRICVLLGGRVAEMIRYGDVTTGASNDLERATQIARQMVTQFGMSEKLGLVTLGRKQHEVFLGHDIVDDRNYSEEVAHTIDLEIRAIIDSCMNKSHDILTENREHLEEITQRLLKEECSKATSSTSFSVIRRKSTPPRAIREKTPRRRTEKRQRKRTAEAPPQNQETKSCVSFPTSNRSTKKRSTLQWTKTNKKIARPLREGRPDFYAPRTT